MGTKALTRTALATPVEVADYLGVPERTLTAWRYHGTGPKSLKVGKFVRYRWADLDAWLETQTREGDT